MGLRDEGGPAFPCFNDADKEYNWIARGMTLRDWFAGQAMVGLLSYTDFAPKGGITAVAEASYRLADVMLMKREEGS